MKITVGATIGEGSYSLEVDVEPGMTGGELLQRLIVPLGEDGEPARATALLREGVLLELSRPLGDQGICDGACLSLELEF